MPLNVPPVASAPLYARNRATGETYVVSAPSTGSEVEVDSVEPPGEWELWVDTSEVGQIPPPSDDYLPLAGGTLTGPLVLAADPVAPLEAATKAYADGVLDTGYVRATVDGLTWTPLGGTTAGAYRQGRMVTIYGTLWISGLEIFAGSPVLVATVSAEFRPVSKFIFPAVWNEQTTGFHHGDASIRTDGGIYVVSPVSGTLWSDDWVSFNATFPID